MDFNPTEEQLAIVESAKENKTLVIDAGAGCAKTSTLALVAESIVEPSLLLVFNKSAKEDSQRRFPSHVEVRTTHSLAYGVTGRLYQHKLSRPRGGYVNVANTGGEIARYYGIAPISLGMGKWVTSAHQGLMVRNTVEKFEQSADKVVSKKHLPRLANELNITGMILDLAKKLWKERLNIDSKVLISHDTYMKIYQLSEPKVNYPVIYLDEAQDTSACTLDIILRQAGTAKIIIVGDNRQAIYGWRGCVNAMKLVDGKHMVLSQSFRFGQESADLANRILEQTSLRSAEGLTTKVGGDSGTVDRSKPYTILYRTNSALLVDALEEIQEGKRVNLEINTSDLCKQLTDAEHLFFGRMNKVKHESLIMYSDWEDFELEAESSPELKRIIKLVTNGRVKLVIKTLNGHKNTDNPDIVMTTAHKSKGREWPQVVLGNDYPSYFKEDEWVGLTTEEQNTLYVALTRGRDVLEYNSTVEEVFFKPSLNIREVTENMRPAGLKGEQAQYTLMEIEDAESLRDKYVDGIMTDEEAFENGFTDPMGVEQEGIQEAWDRSVIPTMENLDQACVRQSEKMWNSFDKRDYNGKSDTAKMLDGYDEGICLG